MGTVLLVNPQSATLEGQQAKVIQYRRLGAERRDQDMQKHMIGFLETTQLILLPGGRLVFKVSGGRGLEVLNPRTDEITDRPPCTEK